MSEELKDASIKLPKAMLYAKLSGCCFGHLLISIRWATFANGIMGITMIITFW